MDDRAAITTSGATRSDLARLAHVIRYITGASR
jgi:hypothetical protein